MTMHSQLKGSRKPSGPSGPGPEPDSIVDAARAAGHPDSELLALLRANTDPDRHPLKLWLHVLRNSDFQPSLIVFNTAA